MKFLLDMNLSPSWLKEFEQRGIVAAHWSDIGAINAPDDSIMQYAEANGYIVFTHDLDFGTMLAVTGATGPQCYPNSHNRRFTTSVIRSVF